MNPQPSVPEGWPADVVLPTLAEVDAVLRASEDQLRLDLRRVDAAFRRPGSWTHDGFCPCCTIIGGGRNC